MDDNDPRCSIELNKNEDKELPKAQIAPYGVKTRLERASYLLESEVGGKLVRAHANRLRRAGRGLTKASGQLGGESPNSLGSLENISNVEWRRSAQNGYRRRHFILQLFRERSPRWISESELPLALVNLSDRKQE